MFLSPQEEFITAETFTNNKDICFTRTPESKHNFIFSLGINGGDINGLLVYEPVDRDLVLQKIYPRVYEESQNFFGFYSKVTNTLKMSLNEIAQKDAYVFIDTTTGTLYLYNKDDPDDPKLSTTQLFD
jgi:hypothetical protein